MSSTKIRTNHGLSLVQADLETDDQFSDTKEHGGGGGGGSMDNLEKRVERLEENVADIKLNLATLTTRSENFATKADVIGIRVEMAELSGNLKQEIAEVRSELKSDMADIRTDFQKEMRTQTAWLCGIVIAAMGVFAGVIALLK